MKNNKGFTLIELLLTIVLLSVISVISFVSITAIINKNKENQCNTLVNDIKLAAKEYVSDNRYGSINTSITAKSLLDGNYLSGKITSSCTNEEISPQDIEITINLDSSRNITGITVTDKSGNLNCCDSF